MKIAYLLCLLIIFNSCGAKKESSQKKEKSITVSKFQELLDLKKVKGSILIYDLTDNTYYSNDFKWAKKGNLPASTFKIPNSIIALETDVVQNDSSLFKWNGEPRRMKIWEQDLVLRDAFHYSCVPCYQVVARKIGVKRMNEQLKKLNYGKMVVDSSSIDLFWLVGESKINQFEQINFLQRLHESQLPISEQTETIIKRMIVIDDNEAYKISGKTGWSIRNGRNNGWFVGYMETQNKVYFFATNIEPEQAFDMSMFPMIRKELTYEALRLIGFNH